MPRHVASLVLLAVALTAGCPRGEAHPAPPAPPPALAGDASSQAAPTAIEQPPPRLVARATEAMGTYVQIKVWTRDEAGAHLAIGRAFDEIARLEALMTTWRPDSEVSRINAAAGKAPVAVSPETYAVIARSLEFSRLSHGAFDITFYALKGLWHFDQDLEAKLPDPAEVRRRLPLIDWRKVKLDPQRRTVFLEKAGMRINLGGIAKGYAVDRATDVLRKAGYADCIVQAGGDLMLSGSKDGQPWKTGIRDPRGPEGSYFAVMALVDHAFSTAGDYERSFFVDGKRYHHILDPRTGYPARAARSVTIYAPDAFTADGIDDAVLILGPEAGLKMVEALPDVGAVIVDKDDRVHVSKRLAGKVEILHPPTPGP